MRESISKQNPQHPQLTDGFLADEVLPRKADSVEVSDIAVEVVMSSTGREARTGSRSGGGGRGRKMEGGGERE